MKREWSSVFVLLMLFFSAIAEDAQWNNDSGEKIIGVDNYIFSNDSSDLINTNLIDFQVEYDIAYAQKDFEGVSKALHKISLVYYHLNKLDLASSYAWRSKNVADKHNLYKEELNAFAILFKINENLGNVKEAARLKKKYFAKLDEISVDPVISNYAMQEPLVAEASEPEVQEAAQTEKDPIILVQPIEKPNEAQAGIPFLWLGIGIAGGVLVLGIISFIWIANKKSKKKKAKATKNNIEVKVKKTVTQNDVKSTINKENLSVTPVAKRKNIRVSNPTKPIQTSSEIKPEPPIIDEKVKAPVINRETRSREIPLWISAIDHHIKEVKVTSGISVSFIYAGKMDAITEKVQDAFIKNIKNGVDALVKDPAVLNISVQLVQSNKNIIGSIFARPVSTTRQNIKTDVVSILKPGSSNSTLINVSSRILENGSLKLVLKSDVALTSTLS